MNITESLLSKVARKNKTRMSLVVDRKSVVEKSLSDEESNILKNILEHNRTAQSNLSKDVEVLIRITSELHSVTSQAILLHGELIERCRNLLGNYKDGTFSLWLSQVYTNRQTPYNFLRYYQLYSSLSVNDQKKMLSMPKKAIYILASRNGDISKKSEIIREYRTGNQDLLLKNIKDIFPIEDRVIKKENVTVNRIISMLSSVESMTKTSILTRKKSKEILKLLTKIESNILM